MARSQVSTEKQEIRKIEADLSSLAAAQSLIQHSAQDCQQRVHAQIAAVVSKCLSTVFDDPYSFQIDFVMKRGKTDALLSFYRDGAVFDPLDSTGGGVVDIAAFALRLASILCSQPQLRKILVLDEPFKHIHVDKVPLIAQMLETLSKETKTQIILVTQLPGLEVGKVIRIE
jgi:DNA repair exonuclease SbcCD ATPase subunit